MLADLLASQMTRLSSLKVTDEIIKIIFKTDRVYLATSDLEEAVSIFRPTTG